MLPLSPPISSADDERFISPSLIEISKSITVKLHSDSGSDGDSDDSSVTESLRCVKRRFENIRAALRKKTISLNDRDQFHQFVRDNEDILDGIGENGTLLHYLVEDARDKRFTRYEPLVVYLVRHYPVLLTRKDDCERTILPWAIQKRRHDLVHCICDHHPQIGEVIAIQGLKSQNCLHVAIQEGVRSALILELVKLASLETFLALDNEGNTPLHHAVAYERCTEAGLRVVQALLNRCDKAVDAQSSTVRRLSPYLYHLFTRAEAEAKESAMQNIEQHLSLGVKDANVLFSSPIHTALTDPGQEISQQYQLGMSQQKTLNGINQPAKSHPGYTGDPSFAKSSTAERTSLALDDSANPPKDADKRHKEAFGARPDERSIVTQQTADAIRDYLKVHCLRTRDHDQAIELLYGQDTHRELYFDLCGSSSRYIDEEWINRGLDYLCFDNMLQYVALPQLELTKKQQASNSRFARRKNMLPDGDGRRDMVFIFDFLRKKGVSRILRVIVDDILYPAHSDEAIEQAIRGFGVEVWDWRKIDISLDTIMDVALDVRELHLYSNGNNAVLRGWSDHGGLAQLKNLQTVYLHMSQGLETVERSRRNINQFCNRLAALRPDIQVQLEERLPNQYTDQTGSFAEGAGERDEHPHRWITCMDNFADFIQNIRTPVGSMEDVRVALIDDGVDIEEKTLRGKIVGGRSFSSRDHAQNLQQPFYVSGSGHGTVMASLICRVCPTAKLFVVKVAEHVSASSGRQISANSAARAVRAAIDQKVHVITMPWTIQRNEQNAADIRDLEAAIGAAAKAGIMMFSAASDQGPAIDVTFPAACVTTKNIFKIGAAEASGTVWKWVGDAAAVDFIFPGHEVIKERPNDAPIDKCQTLTGSWVATAIASGFAAMILYCVQLSFVQTRAINQPGKVDHFEGLQHHERMREAFLAIGTTHSSGNKYIEVWNVFEKAVDKSQGKPPDQFPAIVNEVANKLKARKMLE
ncbi:subtilisin-like protein [Aspergillus uvarum CBS 121591]|uniref:Subtilisin-like protein n=1 Tax=Aspergillus uvarum CBS 121591 TaxID=1448315 RepID=A0A319C6R3_9EURO|nr:subtilisin-like protein [Aspergillus uvarum CBS 121591]PYH81025.1 subtilisin-like protein [Aspergillus uvarum CBS 121591]